MSVTSQPQRFSESSQVLIFNLEFTKCIICLIKDKTAKLSDRKTRKSNPGVYISQRCAPADWNCNVACYLRCYLDCSFREVICCLRCPLKRSLRDVTCCFWWHVECNNRDVVCCSLESPKSPQFAVLVQPVVLNQCFATPHVAVATLHAAVAAPHAAAAAPNFTVGTQTAVAPHSIVLSQPAAVPRSASCAQPA